jgi:hypothetical protein
MYMDRADLITAVLRWGHVEFHILLGHVEFHILLVS